jgi:hypothetical protein
MGHRNGGLHYKYKWAADRYKAASNLNRKVSAVSPSRFLLEPQHVENKMIEGFGGFIEGMGGIVSIEGTRD